MKRLILLAKFIWKLGIRDVLKTLIFNFKYFPLNQAIHLPVHLSHKVEIRNMKRGKIILEDVGGGCFWNIKNRFYR